MKDFTKRISFLKELPDFIKQNIGHVIFIALFYSFTACYAYVINCDFSLHRFPGRMIGIATLEGFDVVKRASLFYNAIFVFLSTNACFYFIAFLFAREKQNILKELVILNISSLVGCLLIFLKVLDLINLDGIRLIILIHVIAIVFLLIKQLLLHNSNKKLFGTELFSIVACISICFLFLFREFTSLLHFNFKPSLFISVLVFSSISFFIIALFIRKLDYTAALGTLTKALWVFIPVMLLPLFTPLKDEIYLILNAKGILYFTPLKLYLILLLFVAAWIYLRSSKQIEKLGRHSSRSMLSTRYFPLLILGVTTYIYYSPFISGNSTEMFELANRFLPVMEFLKYHTIPLFEKFNSHNLSEIFTLYLYSLFNAPEGLTPLIYDFIFPVSTALMTYFIVKDFTYNAYIAFFVVVLFPLEGDLTVDFFPALLSIYVLYKIIYFPSSVKNYLLLFFSFIFFIAWKIDTGVACISSMLVILIVYSLSKITRFNYRYLLVALGYILIVILAIYLAFLIRGTNLIHAFLNEYNYLSSAQSYGYSILHWANDSNRIFEMQYFVFPVIALLIAGYVVFNLKKLATYKNLKFAALSLLFCIGYYLFNFERGLVRHSFIEHTDIRLSPLIFFIISGSGYLLCKYQSQLIKFLLFFFVSFLLLTGFKYPQCNPSMVYESFKSKLNTYAEIMPKAGLKREIQPAMPGNQFDEFRNFISKELKSDETFIDFTNEPMLYYYMQKITPSYFYQSPASLHNNYLQEKFLENLSNYKVPLLVFSNTLPLTPYEMSSSTIDYIPNGLRHYRIAEYLYQNYQPLASMQSLCLWKEKKSTLDNPSVQLFSYKKSALSDTTALKNIDYLATAKEGYFLITASFATRPFKDGLMVYRKSNDTAQYKLAALFSDSSAGKIYYSLKHTEGEKVKFNLTRFADASSLEIDEVKYIPDIYSLVPQQWQLGLLPYIWANYDKKIQTPIVQKAITNTDTLINKSRVSFNLPDDIDKSTGNYIFLSLDAKNENSINVQLTYGQWNGSLVFTLPPGEGVRTFAIRISSQYNWYAKDNETISLYAQADLAVHLKKIILLKGD